MTSTKAATQLQKYLDQIRNADIKQVQAQFQIANVLTAIRDHCLYEEDGYGSFKEMVAGELHFSYAAANRYISLYNNYTRFKYKKDEFLLLMQNFGWRKLEQALSNSEKKIGARAIQNYLNSIDTRDNQFNFNLYDASTARKFEATLAGFGMEHTKGGTRIHLTTSLLAMIDDYARLKAMESSLTIKVRAKARAAAQAEQLELSVE